jgi:DNA polymerase I-like protein with 3'-5' exonuclease and polymerase domains
LCRQRRGTPRDLDAADNVAGSSPRRHRRRRRGNTGRSTGADLGSGWFCKAGHVCGFSVAYREDGAIRGFYAPLRHPDSNNFDREKAFAWLRDLFASEVRVVTMNGLYDYGWLHADAGIVMPPPDRLEEIGAMAATIDENRLHYDLDNLCEWRGIPGKNVAELHAGAAAIGLPKKANVRANIWQLPARLVGSYAEADAAATLALFESLDPILDQENTRSAYRLDVELLPLVHEMRWRGIRIDTDAAVQARDALIAKRDTVLAELADNLGATIGIDEVHSRKWLVSAFDQHKIAYPLTAKGNPSFRAGQSGWLDRHEHWLPRLVARAKRYHHAAINFVDGHILKHLVANRIHSEMHPFRAEDGGAKSSRFSYSDPPLQQMPSRDPEIGPLIRSLFLPEDGEIWLKPDASQQEFRLLVHYAESLNLAGAHQAAEKYRTDPHADFHSYAAGITGLERSAAKNVNFAKIYGAGEKKFSQMINKPLAEATALYNQYDRALPFARQLAEICERTVTRDGYLELLDGARRHWTLWAPPGKWAKGAGPCDHDEAVRRINDETHPWYGYNKLERVKVYTALNGLIQGSAARHTKCWMRDCCRHGIVPLLQMHDSLDCSIGTREQAELIAALGCAAIKLSVPMVIDVAFGRSWGDATHAWDELHGAQTVSLSVPAVRPAQLPTPTPSAPTPIALHALFEQQPGGEKRKISCPFHHDNTPSLHVYDDGHWHCFSCQRHGNDIVDLLVIVKGIRRDEADALLQSAPAPRAIDPGETLAAARLIWDTSTPIRGSLAEKYLREVRGIDINLLPATDALRFHGDCPFGPGVRYPCMIARFDDVIDDNFAGLHRIALPPAFAGNKVPRMTLGVWPRPRAIKLWPANGRLYVAEGIETAMAAALLRDCGAPMQPVWAAGSSGNTAKLPVLAGVDVTLLVDRDLSGEDSARKCRRRYLTAGRDVRRLQTPAGFKDFNDLLLVRDRS